MPRTHQPLRRAATLRTGPALAAGPGLWEGARAGKWDNTVTLTVPASATSPEEVSQGDTEAILVFVRQGITPADLGAPIQHQ